LSHPPPRFLGGGVPLFLVNVSSSPEDPIFFDGRVVEEPS